MARRAAAVDANQRAIVDTFRKAGATVQHLHIVGGGCPDLIVGWRGVNLLVEVKDGDKPPSARRLTPAERYWHEGWRGQVDIVETETQALNLLGLAPLRGSIS